MSESVVVKDAAELAKEARDTQVSEIVGEGTNDFLRHVESQTIQQINRPKRHWTLWTCVVFFAALAVFFGWVALHAKEVSSWFGARVEQKTALRDVTDLLRKLTGPASAQIKDRVEIDPNLVW